MKNGSQCHNCVPLRLKRCCNAASADDDCSGEEAEEINGASSQLPVSFPRPHLCSPRQASMLFPRMRAMTRPIPLLVP